MRHCAARTLAPGKAVLASGVTAIAGFAVLVFTDIRMLRDFGLVTVFDLAVALIGVLVVLPAALVWSEGGVDRLAALVARLRRRGRAGRRRCPVRTRSRAGLPLGAIRPWWGSRS